MKTLLLVSVTIFMSFITLSQTDKIVNFGNNDSQYILGDGIIDRNGNHIFICNTNEGVVISFHNPDYVPLWSKQFDFNCSAEMGKLIELSNGNYLACTTQGLNNDIESIGGQLIQFNDIGDVLWHKSTEIATISNMVEIDQNRIAILTIIYNQGYLTVIDDNGDLDWCKKMSNTHPYWVGPRVTIRTHDDNLVVVSNITNPTDGDDSYSYFQHLTKFDFDGNLIWEKAYDSPLRHTPSKAIQAESGSFYTIGSATNDGDFNSSEMLISKYSETGDFIMSKTYGFDWHDTGNDLIQLRDGNFIAIGLSKPIEHCGGNLVVMKFDENLDTIFTKFYGQAAGGGAFYWNLHKQDGPIDDLIYTYGGGSVWSSISSADVHLIKTDGEFDLPCGLYSQAWYVNDVADYPPVTSPATHEVSSISLIENTGYSDYTFQVVDACSGEPLAMEDMESERFLIYPNPSQGNLSIQAPMKFEALNVKVKNIAGQLVYENQFYNNSLVNFQFEQVSGTYFVELRINDIVVPIQKVIIQ